MMEYLFGLRSGASSVKLRGGPEFGHNHAQKSYRFVDDEEKVNRLKNKTDVNSRPYFRWLSVEKIDEVLESAEGAVELIDAGEFDGYLDLLLVAERERYGNRITVVDSIAARDREIEAEREQLGDTDPDVTPADVRP